MSAAAGRLEEVWARADEHAAQRNDPQYAQEVLTRFIESLKGGDREEAESVCAEWVFSGDPRRQFDALATIQRLELRSAVPALRRLAAEFEESSEAGAPYDWAWVNRIIGQLDSSPSSTEPDF